MKKVRIAFVLGWGGFLASFAVGMGTLAIAEGLAKSYFDIPSPGDAVILFFKVLAMLELAMGLVYLLAAIIPRASRTLLMVATCAKVLVVLGELAGLFAGKLSFDQISASVILDGILILVGIYAIVVAGKQIIQPRPSPEITR